MPLAPMPGSFSEQLRDAIIPYFGTGKPNKRLASEIAGVSPRTLQRRLAQQHTGYSRVLDQARLLKAAALLKETDMKLLDISLMLGYASAPGFTRAFRRWTGVSPRAYRQLHSTAWKRAAAHWLQLICFICCGPVFSWPPAGPGPATNPASLHFSSTRWLLTDFPQSGFFQCRYAFFTYL